MMTEDITQLRSGYSLYDQQMSCDCEDFAGNGICVAKAVMKLKRDLEDEIKGGTGTIERYLSTRLFGQMGDEWRTKQMKALYHLTQQIESVECKCVTCEFIGFLHASVRRLHVALHIDHCIACRQRTLRSSHSCFRWPDVGPCTGDLHRPCHVHGNLHHGADWAQVPNCD